jgi:putative endopeptidase
MRSKFWLLAAVSLITVAATSVQAEDLKAQHLGRWGFDATGQNKAVKPGDDFFQFANGAWEKTAVIPDDKSSYGAFSQLFDLSEKRVQAILDESAKANGPTTTVEGKIGAFYRTALDEKTVEALGAKPLKPYLASIRAIRTHDQMTALMGRSQSNFNFSLFDLYVTADDKDPDHYVAALSHGGLGMPDRDYYLKPSFAAKKAAYQAYIAKSLKLAGWADPAGSAKAVLAFETEIARAHWPAEDQRDADKTYNPLSVAELQTLAPGLNWANLFKGADLPDLKHLIIAQKSAFPKLARLYARTPVKTLQAWQAFHTVSNASPYLSQAFVQARFDFFGKALNGQPQMAVRWKRAVRFTNAQMGEAIGQVYVARYFPPDSKAKMQALVADLKSAFRARIETLEWMSPETRAEALKKLDSFVVKIGYPDKFRDYTALDVRDGDLFGNIERSGAFEWARQARRVGQVTDRAEWGMVPQEVNAYNNSVYNEVVFPAAILQPPFFDPDADPAVNYGAIGGVIGHEMTHGFDDQGRKYDSTGHLRDWWKPEDAKRFEAVANRLADQYSAMEPLPGVHINGKLTLGENIADQGGLTLALQAYRTSLKGQPAPTADGLTGDQRVFLGWAQVWREKNRPDALKAQITTDPHSPGTARVNGVMPNVDGWYGAFDVKPGDKLYLSPDQRAKVW